MYRIEGKSQPGCGCAILVMVAFFLAGPFVAPYLGIRKGWLGIVLLSGFIIWMLADGPAIFRLLFRKNGKGKTDDNSSSQE